MSDVAEGRSQKRAVRARVKAPDPITAARLTHAITALKASGRLQGVRSKRVSARVDPGVFEAAKAKSGLENDSDVINAALAVIAAPDDFGSWFARQAGRLPADFELAV
jgi:hypothetical protein